MTQEIMTGRKVRFKGFEFGEGWCWEYGGEGKILAETKTAYKIKSSWFVSQWIPKEYCEEIISK